MPNLLTRIRAATIAAKSAFKSFDWPVDWVNSNRPGNRYASSGSRSEWMTGSGDYASLAGDLWQNSACQAVLNWVIRAWPESYPCVKKLRGGKKVVVDDHPLTALLQNPNEFDDDTSLWGATIISYWVDGNAYWRINRTRGGEVGEFEFIPHWAISPYREPGRRAPGPSYYLLSTEEGMKEIPTYDIVHFRFGKDPDNALLGLSPWASVRLEVYNDREAALYTATTLHNKGAAWMIVSPVGDNAFENPQDVRDEIEERTSGRNRNRVMLLNGEVKVNFPPPFRDVQVDALRRLPETRICALGGIPAMAVGLASGIERSTFSNTDQAEQAGWYTVVSVQRLMGRQLTKQVLWEPRNYNERIGKVFAGFDYTEVRALQEDKNEEAERIVKLFEAGLIDEDEARIDMGREPFTEAQRAVIEARREAARESARVEAAANAPAPPKSLPGKKYLLITGEKSVVNTAETEDADDNPASETTTLEIEEILEIAEIEGE